MTTGPTGSVAILHDMVEEGWPSMDQMGRLLTTRVPVFAPGLAVEAVHHPLLRLATHGRLSASRAAFLADRVVNRMWLYPRRVRRSVRGRFDLYHVVDHSYAQLALDLPAERTLVSCHDIDTFRSLVTPAAEPRTALFRAMTRRILAGLRRAAVVVCGSGAARDDVVRFGLVDPSRIRVVPNGIDPALLHEAPEQARAQVASLLPRRADTVDLLHVGSDIPRKRLDRVIDVAAGLQARGHRVRLVRVGSPLSAETIGRARERRYDNIVELPFLDAYLLRAVYERCAVLVLPSDREGYGLPVLEAFAAGTPVVASDIPALRESSGGLATLVPADGIAGWIAAVEHALAAPDADGAHAAARRARASLHTWEAHVQGVVPIYAELLACGQAAVA